MVVIQRVQITVGILISLLPLASYGSDMGNGPMMLGTWLLGSVVALIIAFLNASDRDELGALSGFDRSKFGTTLLVSLPVVFVLGLIALAT